MMFSRTSTCSSLGHLALAAFLPALSTVGAAEATGGRPNIIVIMTDDQGWGDTAPHALLSSKFE